MQISPSQESSLKAYLSTLSGHIDKREGHAIHMYEAQLVMCKIGDLQIGEATHFVTALVQSGLLAKTERAPAGVELTPAARELLRSSPGAAKSELLTKSLQRAAGDKWISFAATKPVNVAAAPPAGAVPAWIYPAVLCSILGGCALLSMSVTKPSGNPYDPEIRRKVNRAVEAADIAAEKHGVSLTDDQVRDIISRVGIEEYRRRYPSR